MPIPLHLSHKPIIGVDNYETLDADRPADAKALSIGLAQYGGGNISAKVFRYNDDTDRWSPQSEELPIPRVLDLAILITSTMNEKSDKTASHLGEKVIAEADHKEVEHYYKKNREDLFRKLEELKKLITALGI